MLVINFLFIQGPFLWGIQRRYVLLMLQKTNRRYLFQILVASTLRLVLGGGIEMGNYDKWLTR